MSYETIQTKQCVRLEAHKPYEFGVKVSVATTLSHARGGQFVNHVKAMPGKPYDGHTLATVIPEMEALIGNAIERVSGFPCGNYFSQMWLTHFPEERRRSSQRDKSSGHLSTLRCQRTQHP